MISYKNSRKIAMYSIKPNR